MSSPHLEHLSDPVLDEVWHEALDEPGGVVGDVLVLSELRVMPRRRITALGTRGADPVVVKVFASPRARGNDRRLVAVSACGLGDIVPRSLGVSRSGQVGVLSYAAGTVLDIVEDDAMVTGAGSAGRALAALHRSGALFDRAWHHVDEIAQLLRRAPHAVLPLAQRVATESVDPHPELVPSHRDFHPRQVVVDGAQVHLIDLDDAAFAPPGLDVGNMVAHLRREAALGRRDDDVVQRAVSAFLDGYGTPPCDRLTWERLALVRLAGLAETRHRNPAERDALLALVTPPGSPGPCREQGRATPAAASETGHADRPVRTDVDADGQLLVVKRYVGGAGANVHKGLLDLWQSPFGASRQPAPGVPRPVGFDPLTGELAMAHVDGPALGLRGDVGRALDEAPRVATLLAQFHRSGIRVDRVRSRSRLMRSAKRKARDRAGSTVGPEFAATVELLSAASAALPDDTPLVVAHGDFSPRNLLVSAAGLVLIDLDRLQMASPLRDIGYWTAWIWATATAPGHGERPVVDPRGGWLLGDPFVEHYLAESGLCLDVQGRRELDLHRALSLVRIAHGWSALSEQPDEVTRILTEARSLADRSTIGRARS